MVLSLTIDHRVVDGEPAAAFLDEVLSLLEEPSGLA
jgi:pyruvate/2-oxoglutarate dehydrogenase complex dihydrolipoamide acyltransferase (E2) component